MPLALFTPRKNMSPVDLMRSVLAGQTMVVERPDVSAKWRFRFSDGHFLSADLWRLLDDMRIVTTVEDDGHFFGFAEAIDVAARVNDRVENASVRRVAIDSRTGDLSIVFDKDLELQLPVWSSGYECWHLYGPPPACETLVVGGNGGGL